MLHTKSGCERLHITTFAIKYEYIQYTLVDACSRCMIEPGPVHKWKNVENIHKYYMDEIKDRERIIRYYQDSTDVQKHMNDFLLGVRISHRDIARTVLNAFADYMRKKMGER